jgi:hypothetical protein
MIMVEDPAYLPAAGEAFDAIRGLREAAIGVVSRMPRAAVSLTR